MTTAELNLFAEPAVAPFVVPSATAGPPQRVAYMRLGARVPRRPSDRGSWWEKRNALLQLLRARGHSVMVEPDTPNPIASADVVMLEFGPSNPIFCADRWAAQAAALRTARGRIIYLNDDPALLPLPLEIAEALAECEPVQAWLNTPLAAQVGAGLSLEGGEVYGHDAPFGSLLPHRGPSPWFRPSLVYQGRNAGRLKVLQRVRRSGVPLTVLGRPEEWPDDWSVRRPPPQDERHAMLGEYAGALLLADQQHHALQWRTGRAYHALSAGVPVVTPEPMSGVPWARPMGFNDKLALWTELPAARDTAVVEQGEVVAAEGRAWDATLAEAGL